MFGSDDMAMDKHKDGKFVIFILNRRFNLIPVMYPRSAKCVAVELGINTLGKLFLAERTHPRRY